MTIPNQRPLRILVACEYSGTVRNAFLALGHDAWSCDLLPSEDRSNRHIVGDARDLLNDGWDLLMVAHPPCTRLCNSGVRWLTVPPAGKTIAQMWAELDEGAALFSDFWNAPIDRIAIENPVMHKHAKTRIVNFQDFAQSIQPWQFGHGETKRTCLWLKNLPPLLPTEVVAGRNPRVHHMPPSPDRWKERSRFYPGIAKAMAPSMERCRSRLIGRPGRRLRRFRRPTLIRRYALPSPKGRRNRENRVLQFQVQTQQFPNSAPDFPHLSRKPASFPRRRWERS